MTNKSGIIIIDKPTGISTNGVIQKVKRNLNIKKVGHAGTLDPLASGVVVVLVNNGTKISDYLLNADKRYLVTMKLFSSTDSYDSDGVVTKQQDPFEITVQQVKQAIAKYNGLNYNQIPPIYSAIKVDGKKLYEYAREDKEVVIKARNITIKELNLIEWDKEAGTITLDAACSKGTYIRSLIVDIAKEFGALSHVIELRRTKSGFFDIQAAVNMYDASEKNIIDIYTVLENNGYKIINVDNIQDVLFGKKIILDIEEDFVFIKNDDNNIVACYEREKNKVFKCRRGGLNN